MKRFHKNLDIMSFFTAGLLICGLIFWRTFLNIAITNVFLNGVIIGTTIFGVVLCFIKMFRLLPEYKWLHAYFDGRSDFVFAPKLLRPVSMVLHNRHIQVTESGLSELLELVAFRIDEEREDIRYITNTLIFLGLLGTFWGLILTIGGFASLLMNIDFENAYVLQEMQIGMSGPLSGMATAFTSSLLGLGGSLTIGFLGLQVQFAQNTIFSQLTDFMSQYVLQKPQTQNTLNLATNAPVDEKTYKKISEMYDAFTTAGFDVRDLVRIDGKHPAIIAIGTNERLFVATLVDNYETLQNTLKRIELCFADTLEGINIDTRILCVSGTDVDLGNRVLRFANTGTLAKYLMAHKNVRPTTKQDLENFNAYAEYIDTVTEYLFKPKK